jgi:protein TonB
LPVFDLDQSRPASFAGSTSWNCPFPPEADADDVNQAVVSLVVTVGPDGSPVSVKVLSDPGSGFGAAARRCAFAQHFTPALDASGRRIAGTTQPIRVRFVR